MINLLSNNWILLTFIYATLTGCATALKKQALTKSTIIEVLMFYSFLTFLLTLPEYKVALSVEINDILFIALKSLCIFSSWLLSLQVIKKIDIGLYGILDSSRVIFGFILTTIILGEKYTTTILIGSIIIIVGICMSNAKHLTNSKMPSARFIIYMLVSSLLNSFAAIQDKLSARTVPPVAMQFWFLFFLVVLYFIYILIRREKINFKIALSNKYIWLLCLCFFIADRALFTACASPDSINLIINVIKRLAVVFLILIGQVCFKEKDTLYKLMCAGVIIIGIIIALL